MTPRLDAKHDPTRNWDVLLGTLMLVIALPAMMIIAFLIWAQDGGCPLFSHLRVGRGGREFRCWKFRTMVPDAETRLTALLQSDSQARAEWDADHKLRVDPRVTPFGTFLRVMSLDELPQLINVLNGDMSLVGPRPIVRSEIARYGRWFRHYTNVSPGITGLWQVNGRNDIGYRQRVAMDIMYSRRRSAGIYLVTLAATLPAVLLRRGSY